MRDPRSGPLGTGIEPVARVFYGLCWDRSDSLILYKSGLYNNY
jgi:hypothetical protein